MKILSAILQPFSSSLFNSKAKMGALSGVFLPNILQMLGVLLFLRFGWILSQVGIYQMLLMISISSCILFITGLSMSSIVTNMKIGSGGSYYIISRSLGLHLGSAIGILLSLAQITSIALCTVGFAISFHEIFPVMPVVYIEITTICILALVSYLSTSIASKMQLLIFVVICLAFYAIFSSSYEKAAETSIITKMPFWGAFSMVFAAMTGIEAGMSMSGDLKNPNKALPIGTMLSILVAYIIYIMLALFIQKNISYTDLQHEPFILCKLSNLEAFVMLGILGSTLSSSLGSMLGAPRTIQALAKDTVLPSFLAKGYGESNLPRNATILTFALALILTLTTNMNQIIPLLTMICLVFYGLLNFVCFFESFMQNPSWRPSFETPWYISLAGCVSCFLVMILINAHFFSLFFLFIFFIYLSISARNLHNNWDDIRYSIFGVIIRICMEKLKHLRINAKSWRPHLLAISQHPNIDNTLIYFGGAINQNHGLFTYSVLLPKEEDSDSLHKQMLTGLEKDNVSCFLHLCSGSSYYDEIDNLIKHYGLGPVIPNTVMIDYQESICDYTRLAGTILNAYNHSRNFLIVKSGAQKELIFKNYSKKNPKLIDIWWGGSYRKNVDLSIALIQLLQRSYYWKNTKVTIKSLVKSQQERSEILQRASDYYSIIRLKELCFDPYVEDYDDFYESLLRHSLNASHLTFIGLRHPKFDETIANYQEYIQELFIKTEKLPNVIYILAGEKLNFLRIFEQKQ
ncbi:MAG: amino acid permease [Chlamydiales bacterium]|nr:amino acid permease [Chlamydiales bacterium]